MLVLSRRADESIVIQPADGVDANMTMAELFATYDPQGKTFAKALRALARA